MVEGLGIKSGTCGWGSTNTVMCVFPVATIQLRRDALDGGSASVSGMTVLGVADVSSGVRRAIEQDNSYR